MLTTLAIGNYRSINPLVLPLGQLNLARGANGSGESNLYMALRLLAETAQGGVIEALAREGGPWCVRRLIEQLRACRYGSLYRLRSSLGSKGHCATV